MSVVDIQQRARRLGEIRTGDKDPQRGFPVSLDTFRLTSDRKRTLDAAANLYGGQVTEWGDRWQVTTERGRLDVIVPPQPGDITWYEEWSQGGLQKRCNGESILNHGDPIPCNCDPEHRTCKPITRINFMLPELPDIGVWLLSTTSYFAAAELGFAMNLVALQMQTTGTMPAAALVIDHREIRKPGEATKQFTVPVLEFADTLAELTTGTASLPSPAESLPPVDGPPALGGDDRPSVLPESDPPSNATEPRPPDVFDEIEGKHVPEAASVPAIDAWPRLLDILEEPPTEGNMEVVQDRVRRLFNLMEACGYQRWGDDGLHAAIGKSHQAVHLADLKRASLDLFVTKAFETAKELTKGDDS